MEMNYFTEVKIIFNRRNTPRFTKSIVKMTLKIVLVNELIKRGITNEILR